MIVQGRIRVLAVILTAGAVAVCQAAPLLAQTSTAAPAAAASQAGAGVVEVAAVDFAFQAPDVIPAGWTTIRFRNDGEEHHMLFMGRLPEGRTFEDYEREISASFNRAWHARLDGRANEEEALGMIFEAVPDWFPDLQFVGGAGLAAPGVTSDVTIHLEPGNYVLECYVKAPDGTVHFMDGMARPLTVSDQRSDVSRPDPDIRVTLSNFNMTVEGELTSGRRTVEVHVVENPEEGFGHSVHVARLEPGTNVDEVVQWMNWLALDGLRAPAPARFLGGMHPMPAGRTAYFTLDLEPGRYLWLSEATGARGVMKELTVR